MLGEKMEDGWKKYDYEVIGWTKGDQEAADGAGLPDEGLDSPVERVGGVNVRGVLPASGRPQILAALEASAEPVPRTVVVRHEQSILAVVELGREGLDQTFVGGGMMEEK